MSDGLTAVDFDANDETFFIWLGVVPYLTEEAIFATLQSMASLRGGAEVVFDYGDPPGKMSEATRAYHDRRAALVGALNEPWVSYFEPEELQARLRVLGFAEIEDLGPREIRERYWPNAVGSARERGGHILRAASSK